MSKCSYDPRIVEGHALGMYHCPECGEMVVAGIDHPDYSAPMEIQEDYLEVCDPGDPSVGIQSATWKITGGFIFENEVDREEFREAIQQAFGLQAENPQVAFESEIQAENDMWDQAAPDDEYPVG